MEATKPEWDVPAPEDAYGAEAIIDGIETDIAVNKAEVRKLRKQKEKVPFSDVFYIKVLQLERRLWQNDWDGADEEIKECKQMLSQLQKQLKRNAKSDPQKQQIKTNKEKSLHTLADAIASLFGAPPTYVDISSTSFGYDTVEWALHIAFPTKVNGKIYGARTSLKVVGLLYNHLKKRGFEIPNKEEQEKDIVEIGELVHIRMPFSCPAIIDGTTVTDQMVVGVLVDAFEKKEETK